MERTLELEIARAAALPEAPQEQPVSGLST
jgi:hypothetical protein